MLINYGKCAVFFNPHSQGPLTKGDWEYIKLNDTEIMLTRYIGTKTDITVPTEL